MHYELGENGELIILDPIQCLKIRDRSFFMRWGGGIQKKLALKRGSVKKILSVRGGH